MKKINNLHIKFWRNNIFLNLTSFDNKLLFKCSSGYIKAEQQQNLISVLIFLIKRMKINLKSKSKLKINLVLEGAFTYSKLDLVYNQLINLDFHIVFVNIVDKIPHNGCRSKVKNTNLRKRSFLI
jgi:ribosomal protein S11